MIKRWLVGIDWCRSDPPALTRLQEIPNSTVRVPNGTMLVGNSGCIPRIPYHPKLYMFRGSRYTAIICGSGDLSANGLLGGCECGNAFRFESRRNPHVLGLTSWFNDAWRTADELRAIEMDYKAHCDALLRSRNAIPVEDDITPPEPIPRKTRGLSDHQIRQLRTYENFWIEAGALGANLGRGVPGNQLDMTRYTRVFFGAPPARVPPNEIIDYVTLIWDGVSYDDRTLKFGENGMDKLNVPPAGSRGPLFYRDKTLLFSREPTGEFTFTVGDAADRKSWNRKSRPLGALYKLPGGRTWGLF